MNTRILYPIIAVALPLAGIGVASMLIEPCCSVIGKDMAKGTVSVRNRFTGLVKQISSAELARSLKIGDELDADPAMSRIVSIKGVAKTVSLQEPDAVEPCCGVVSIAKDKQIANGLLSGIMTNAGKPYDAVAPFHGVVIAKDLTSGVLHVLDTSVDGVTPINDIKGQVNPAGPITEMRRTMSKVIDKVKVGDPVWVTGGYGSLRVDGSKYAFMLRGAEPVGSIKAWVMEPDPKAEGRYGIVRTNWHEKVGSGYQAIKVFLPGKRDADEYSEFFKKEHSVMEGEYDIVINGAQLEKVPVKAGHATRILLGALRSTAKYENQLAIHDSKGRPVAKIQGTETIALPIGTYQMKVGTRMVKVEIKENEVTNF